jgi:chemotaxis protein methyltransferase CheR
LVPIVGTRSPVRARRKPTGDSACHQMQFGLTQALYEKFRSLIYAETGIWLGDSKKALLSGRLSKRLRALELSTLAEYYQLISDPYQHLERVLMIDAITTNETRFFREPQHFEFLTRGIIPGWRGEAERRLRSKKIRIWSAACSSGEEPYSVAMLLASHLPASEGWDVEILATDISTQVLEKARQGIYSLAKSQDIPKHLLRQFMLKGLSTQASNMKVAPEIRQMVQFMRLNLIQGPYPLDTPFDLILCRNVLIYFDRNSKQKVVDSLAGCLARNGFFLIGHAENLNGVTTSVRSLAPTIYCRAENYSRLVRSFRST